MRKKGHVQQKGQNQEARRPASVCIDTGDVTAAKVEDNRTLMLASATDIAQPERGKTRASLFRRNKAPPVDDKTKKTKKEKRDRSSEPSEKKSWSRFFSTKSKKKKQRERADDEGAADGVTEELPEKLGGAAPPCGSVGAADASVTLPQTATLPTIQLHQSHFSNGIEGVPAVLVDPTDIGEQKPHDSVTLDPAVTGCSGDVRSVSGIDHVTVGGEASSCDHTAKSQVTQHMVIVNDCNRNSDREKHSNISEQSTPNSMANPQPSSIIAAIGAPFDSTLQLPIVKLDASPGIKHRRGLVKKSDDPASVESSSDAGTEKSNLSASQFLSRSRLHITHVSDNLDAFKESSSAPATSLRSVEMDFPLELSFQGSAKRVFVGDTSPSDQRHLDCDKTYIESKSKQKSCGENSEQVKRDPPKHNSIYVPKKLFTHQVLRSSKRKREMEQNSSCQSYGATKLDTSINPSDPPKSIGTQTAAMNVSDATTQSTIDKRLPRPSASVTDANISEGATNVTTTTDASTQSTIDRKQPHPSVDTTEAISTQTILTSVQENHANTVQNALQIASNEEDAEHCTNCQALQRPCLRHRTRHSVSPHLDSIESYLQLLSDIHDMHNNSPDLNAGTPAQDNVQMPSSRTSATNRLSDLDSNLDVPSGMTGEENVRGENCMETNKVADRSPFVRSFRTSQERKQERASLRGSQRKPLEKDENLKNMPVATVRPMVREAGADSRASVTRRSYRTTGATNSFQPGPSGVRTTILGYQTETPSSGSMRTPQQGTSGNEQMSSLVTGLGQANHGEARVGGNPQSELRPWQIDRERARERVREVTRQRERERASFRAQAPVTGVMRSQQPATTAAVTPSARPQVQHSSPTRSTQAVVPPQIQVSPQNGRIYQLLRQVQDELVRIPGVLIVGVRDDRIFVTVAPSEGEQRIPEVLRVLLQHGVATNQCEVGVLPQTLRRAITAFTDDDVIERIGEHGPRTLAVN